MFGKTRQAFYDLRSRQGEEDLQEGLVLAFIQATRAALPRIGGGKLLYLLREDFAAHHITMGRDSFFALLKKHDLLIKRKKRYAITTDSNHPYKKWPDLSKGLTLSAPEQLWVSDITYLRTEGGFIYLSLITDAYSRKIVGYHLSQGLKAQGCISSLQKAIGSLKTGRLPIHHSDRGIQYCCEDYVSILQAKGIAISMTQSGSPYDNALAERVNGILKTELNLDKTFASYSAAVPIVHGAIHAYNWLRPHMSLGNLTPEQAHHATTPLIKNWKTKKVLSSRIRTIVKTVKPYP